MPPDDPIFTNGSGQPTGEAAAARPSTPAPSQPQGTPTPPSPSSSLTLDDVKKVISDTVGGQLKDIGEMKNFMQQMAASLTPQGGNHPNSTPSDDDFWSRLYADPRETIRGELDSAAAPLVAQIAQPVTQMQLQGLAQGIDQKWGSGAWEGILKDEVEGIVKKALAANPLAPLDPNALRATLDGAVGRHVDALAEHRQKAHTTQEEANTEQKDADLRAALQRQGFDMSTLSGGLRKVPNGELKLDPGHEEYLASVLRDTGREIDPRRAALMLTSGNDYASWKKADEAAKKAAGSN